MPHISCGSADGRKARARRERQPARGISTVKINPASTSLRTEIVPPIASTSCARDPEAQPEARVVGRRRRPLVLLEDARLVLGRNSDAAILDPEARRLPVADGADHDRLAAPVADRVRQQVGQHLVDARHVEVAPDRALPARSAATEPLRDASSPKRSATSLITSTRSASCRVSCNLPGRDAGDVDQRRHQRREAIDLAPRDLEPPRQLLGASPSRRPARAACGTGRRSAASAS